MAGHGFCRTDRELPRMLTERLFDGHRLELVVIRRRGAMRVDITNILRLGSRIGERLLHYAHGAGSCLVRHRDMKCIASHAIPDQLAIDAGAASFREFKLFEDHDSRAFTDHKSIAIQIEWP